MGSLITVNRSMLPILCFFFNDTATTEIYTLSLHDALPICLWSGDGHRSLGSLHRPLHAHSRQLAESGGDRNRNLLAAMPGASTHPRSQNSTPRSESLEPANEPRSCQDRLEVRP